MAQHDLTQRLRLSNSNICRKKMLHFRRTHFTNKPFEIWSPDIDTTKTNSDPQSGATDVGFSSGAHIWDLSLSLLVNLPFFLSYNQPTTWISGYSNSAFILLTRFSIVSGFLILTAYTSRRI